MDFYLNNDLVMVHFDHLNDFINAITNLREQQNQGLFTKFGEEKKYRKIYDNIDAIVAFGKVVRSQNDLCTTQHIDELLNYHSNVLVNNPFMLKYFANNFHQYVVELGRLCKEKSTKINSLFDGAHLANPSDDERQNLAKVREASSLLCNFVSNQHASKLCIWNENDLTGFKVEKLEDLNMYMRRLFTFLDSLVEEKPSGVATTNVAKSQWVSESIQENRAEPGVKSLPIQPLHAACELLENVYEQSTAPVDILGHHGIYENSEYFQWSHDWNNKRWLNIERICALIMRTSLEFDSEGHLAYPILNAERTKPKPVRQLEPFSSKHEEQMFQIDFTKTYKSAFTFGARTGAAAFVIGDSVLTTTADTLNILFAPLRLSANSIANWAPDLVKGVRAIKYGASAQKDYYANSQLEGIGATLNDIGRKLYLRFDKSRFYSPSPRAIN